MSLPVAIGGALATPPQSGLTLATSEEGLDFPADTYFGQSPAKQPILYWTNGGYNLGKPSLQKMDVGIKGARLP